MDSRAWDERYSGSDLVWSTGPNTHVEDALGSMPPGRVLDVAAGEGRNALWLAERGWDVTATDFSAVAVERMAELAGRRPGAGLRALVADATLPAPDLEGGYDVVLLCYLQLAEPAWSAALAHAVAAAAPGGLVLVVLHAERNLTEGVGGPQDADVLHDPDAVLAVVAGLPVVAESAEVRERPVEGSGRPALDTVVLLRRRTD